MGKSLVIVESPAKARTINRYLGSDFAVKASMGHVRDLPKKELAVDVDNGFEPTYVPIEDKKKVISEIRKLAKDAEAVYIATDPDREGEAIGWHVLQLLDGGKGPGNVYRVLMEEITKAGVQRAFEHKGDVDLDKVNAQQARRILDRLVGYKLSPMLWDKVRRGISAGRVQSVALRLVVDREREIRAFEPQEYWSITANLEADAPPVFDAKLQALDGDKIDEKEDLPHEEAAQKVLDRLEGASWSVARVEAKKRRRRPKAPFTTSQLQQSAYRRLRFSVKKTMTLAQQLYEGVDLGAEGSAGLITYMRTDSTRVAKEAVDEARGVIGSRFGEKFRPQKPRSYRSRKGAQEAHEAIRPTGATRTPDAVKKYLDRDQHRLYELIWQRFVASQMADAIYDATSVDIEAAGATFRATGSILRFSGFLAAYGDVGTEDDDSNKGDADRELPPLEEGQEVKLLELEPKQHFTQPPPRFTEASLVRELERNGIGRPSTYADILAKIRNRDYATSEDRKFKPTELGEIVVDLLVENFERIMDVNYTARVEDRLDRIEEGEEDWVDALARFWKRFEKELERARTEMRDVKREETPTDEKCEECGKPMVIKFGRYGRFLACTGYPECKNTRNLVRQEDGDGETKVETAQGPEPTGEDCPKCGSELVRRTGRYGPFVGCSNFPKCRYIKPKTVGVDCPECEEGELAEKRTRKKRTFYGCTRYPDCDFATWRKPIPVKCPECSHPFLELKRSKSEDDRLVCPEEDCEYVTAAATEGVPAS